MNWITLTHQKSCVVKVKIDKIIQLFLQYPKLWVTLYVTYGLDISIAEIQLSSFDLDLARGQK